MNPRRRTLLAAAAGTALIPGAARITLVPDVAGIALVPSVAGIALVPSARAQDGRVATDRRIDVMRFSALKAGDALPASIKPYTFADRPRHTRYALVEDEGTVVLRAQADASTSGLVRDLRVDPRTHPILRWRWKPMRLLARSDIATKAGDDFVARVYVAFDLDIDTLPVGDRLNLGIARMIYGASVPLAVLCYVWDARAAVDTVVPNAYTDRVRMIVAESGPARVGRWVSVERNVFRDYQRAFGAAAGSAAPLAVPTINAVIVSTDTDNTGESVETFYGDLWFAAP